MKLRVAIVTTALVASVFLLARARAEENETMFPFTIAQGAPSNITNVQTWTNAAVKPAGADGFIVAREGVFATRAGQTRLLGTNICFGANFPTKEHADLLAASLARFGINVVRLHHMDSRDIWGKNYENSTTEIDPEQLDKLDYLISRFHEKGIYVNINLHVSRAFRERDGFENADKLPTQNKGVDNFDARMIELQKKYAKDLLQHANPYTGKTYADDPGVAVVEINNENSVVASWSWGGLDDLPTPYSEEFAALWNGWLRAKYGETAKLREAWKCRTYPLGEEQAANGVFDGAFKFNATSDWRVESDSLTEFATEMIAKEDAGTEGAALRFVVAKTGEVAWRPQFHRNGLAIAAGKPYRTSFKYRSAKSSEFNVGIIEDHDPWSAIGYRVQVRATTEWQTFDRAFIAPSDDPKVRLTFSGFDAGDEIEIADVSFREGGVVGLQDGETLESGTIPLLRNGGDAKLLGAEARADFADFLHDIENEYWQTMFKYVKGLGVKSLATGTQLQYGYWYNQGRLDYCDIHAYWNHPNFPRKSWDQNDWLIGNTCLANSPASGTLANLSSLRVIGRPFTCSEYDHPYPNFYNAEGNLMLAAVAAFQDWSATFQFAWSHGDNFERDVVSPFFDMCSNQVKMAHLPACYGIFARGDVKSGPGELYYAPEMTEEEEMKIMNGALTGYHRSIAQGLNLDRSLSLAVYSGIDLVDLNLPKSAKLRQARKIESWKDVPERLGSLESKEIVNEFGEIRWNFKEEGKGFFTVDSANSKAFSGFITAPIDLDAVTFAVGRTELGWATISLVKGTNARRGAEKTGKLSSGRYLLTATGHMKNTDAVFKEVGEKDVTTAGHFGGSNGRAPILCEGVPATVTLKGLAPNSVKVYALDSTGARASELDVAKVDNGAAFTIGPKWKTLWYEIVVE
ncbi:MAG: carbohydrate binding domain-containing protein [Thermoguttaceae bacterium]|nr:carbohydrate binding domain-containing protein [Thermoguttaceae bacterium]